MDSYTVNGTRFEVPEGAWIHKTTHGWDVAEGAHTRFPYVAAALAVAERERDQAERRISQLQAVVIQCLKSPEIPLEERRLAARVIRGEVEVDCKGRFRELEEDPEA